MLEREVALETDCELLSIEQAPVPDEFLIDLAPGTYLIGRDIEPDLYRGQVGDDILDSCYWQRSSGVTGDFEEIIANDDATGPFFVEVQALDFALTTGCELEKVNQMNCEQPRVQSNGADSQDWAALCAPNPSARGLIPDARQQLL